MGPAPGGLGGEGGLRWLRLGGGGVVVWSSEELELEEHQGGLVAERCGGIWPKQPSTTGEVKSRGKELGNAGGAGNVVIESI